MRHRASLSFHESDQEAGLVPKGRKNDPALRNSRAETPKQEMARLIRVVAGPASAGERDYQLITKAARRLNDDLPPFQQLSERRARSYWYEEIEDVPSHHMDRARLLAPDQPIEEAINVLQAAKRRINHELERLLDEALGDSPDAAVDRRLLVDRRRDPASDARLVVRQTRLMHSK